MKKLFYAFCLFLFPSVSSGQFLPEDDIAGYSFTLTRTTEVEGRQGVCADNDFYYVSGSKELFKYTKDGKRVCANTSPFDGISVRLNHFGDIDIYNGFVYGGLEFFKDGAGMNISIGVYRADDLSFVKLIPVDSASGQKEVSGIAIDTAQNAFWLSDWTDGASLYKYDLTNGKYLGRVFTAPKAGLQQGALSAGRYLLVTSDDGDAELGQSDNLYAVEKNVSAGDTVKPLPIKKFTEVKLQGEIEGLTYDSAADELLVLFNRGARIIKGMPMGFYPGYEREIHEIYHYKITRKK